MLFVSDNFELSKDKIVVLTKFYPQTKLTNTGNTTANILKSKDGTNWVELTSLVSNQSADITLEEEFIYLTVKEDTTVYFQHQTPNYYHSEQKKNASTSSINNLSSQLVELTNTKADKTFVDTEIGKLGQAILENTENDEQALQEVSDKITALIQADKGLVSAVSGQAFSDEQKQIARANIGAINSRDVTTIIDTGIAQVVEANDLFTQTKFKSLQQIQHEQSAQINSVQYKIDNLFVGGRNYLKQADFGRWQNGSWRDYVFVIDNQTQAGAMFRRRNGLGGQDVVFSFKIRKTGGNILKIGGHSYSLTTQQVYLDGNLVGNNFNSGVDYPNDDLVHTIVIKARDNFDNITADKSLYIQPNRSNNYSHAYSAEIWDCKLERGTIATDYTPAPEDTQVLIESLTTRITALENR